MYMAATQFDRIIINLNDSKHKLEAMDDNIAKAEDDNEVSQTQCSPGQATILVMLLSKCAPLESLTSKTAMLGSHYGYPAASWPATHCRLSHRGISCHYVTAVRVYLGSPMQAMQN